MPHHPVPTSVKVKTECLGKLFVVELKSGKKKIEDPPYPGEEGVVTVVVSMTVRDQLISKGYITEPPIKIPDIESIRRNNPLPGIILSIEEVDPDQAEASGDCLCFENHFGDWV